MAQERYLQSPREIASQGGSRVVPTMTIPVLRPTS
jgi:hypothetical protein